MHAPLKPIKEVSHEDKKKVLSKALMRAAERLNLSRQELSAIIGPSDSSFSRLFNEPKQRAANQPRFYIDPNSKEGQLAILLLRLYRSLDVLFGGNEKQCQLWLRSENSHLQGVPIKLITKIEGLIFVIQYLDAMRGKN